MATIKLSRQQWEMIGNKTGWIKESQSVSKTIGVPKTDITYKPSKEEIEKEIKKQKMYDDADKSYGKWLKQHPEKKVSAEVVWKKLSLQGKKKYNEIIAIQKQIEKLKEKAEQNIKDLSDEAEDMEIENNYTHCNDMFAQLQDDWNDWCQGLGINIFASF